MKKYIKGTYAGLTVYTENIAGKGAVEVKVEDYGDYTFNIKFEDLDEFIEALQEAKEVLSLGRNTDE